jgi:hypothetical protein
MLRYFLCWAALLALPVTAQSIAYQQIIADGYDTGGLVRTHLTANYTHYSDLLTDGYVLKIKPVHIFADSDSTYTQIDTLCRFAGQTHGNQRFGTFLFLPRDNVFYLETYNGYYRHGPSTGYYYSGRIHSQVMYRRDRITGIFRKYHTNGRLAIVKKFHEEPAFFTEYQSYHPSGHLHSEGVYYDDHKVHEWKYYDTNGTLCKIEYYNHRGRLLAIKPQENDLAQ